MRCLGWVLLAIVITAFLSACTSTAHYTLETRTGRVEIDAVSLPIGLSHQALIVATKPSDPRITATVLPDTSAGQLAVSTLTTGAMVGGAATAAYLGLKQAGQVTVP